MGRPSLSRSAWKRTKDVLRSRGGLLFIEDCTRFALSVQDVAKKRLSEDGRPQIVLDLI